MRLLGIAVASSFSLFVGALFAEPISGNDVNNACVSSDGGVQQGFCFGFIIGSVEAMKWGALIGIVASSSEQMRPEEFDLNSSVALGFCIPPSVENGQILDVVVQYFGGHPESRHESARTLIQSALSDAFPC